MTTDSSMPFVFWHRERVRFRDVDLQRIVYYGKYLDYFDNAFYEYLRSLGFETGEVDERHGFDTSVVHLEVDYVAPAAFDDSIDVGVRVTRLGRASLEVKYELRVSERVVCNAKLVLVNYDARTGASRPIPPPIRQAIESSNRTVEGEEHTRLDTSSGA